MKMEYKASHPAKQNGGSTTKPILRWTTPNQQREVILVSLEMIESPFLQDWRSRGASSVEQSGQDRAQRHLMHFTLWREGLYAARLRHDNKSLVLEHKWLRKNIFVETTPRRWQTSWILCQLLKSIGKDQIGNEKWSEIFEMGRVRLKAQFSSCRKRCRLSRY